ncbi:endonuclease [Leptospira hartskeerlii]|uniref:Endonuclease n=1 Tax=Leptospira hartskeerlii TaxID=2023177 RepID=A0A2M9XCU5_9LEPT|nr:jacalin-like lectin [Leptospira hartskeerlii]PJZ25399.1 endonuclease [Leptospira hartskeerlii]PJZ32621.1 endonuclease [Leptospira hartskeerlii]
MKIEQSKKGYPLLIGILLFLFNCNGEKGINTEGLLGLIQKPDQTKIGANYSSLAAGDTVYGSGTFSLLTYNVAGLLEPFSSSNPSENTPYIGPLLTPFDLVQVQEDFNYHAALYANDVHPYRTATSGGMGFGDGLNTLSYFPFTDFERDKWDACNGTDCLTPKGFTLARHTIAPGIFLDVYNLHTNAGTEDADLSSRRSNVLQILSFIEANSAGNAVIVMGDTNTRYTRSGDNIREFSNHGFTDVWIQLIRGGSYPTQGADALMDCDGHRTSAGCEVVDKMFYRGNSYLSLSPSTYLIEEARFVHPVTGVMLSDHYAVSSTFNYSILKNLVYSDSIGGPHGTPFNDVNSIASSPRTSKISLRSGSRIDAVSLQLTNGTVLSHGGTGGTLQTLTLGSGEYVDQVKLCSGVKSGRTRVFYAQFHTNLSRLLTGGSTTSTCTTYTAPSGWGIVGFHGRSGDEVDKLGVIYAPF